MPFRAAARHIALALFCAATGVHLAALQFEWTAVEWATKPLLTVGLLLYVGFFPRRPRKVFPAVGLVCALAGDVVLQFEGTAPFVGGILCFALMQLCYQLGFAASGAIDALLRARAVLAVYAVVFAALVVWLVPQVGGPLGIVVAPYGLLLTATAAISAGAGWAAGAGGALFLVSDTAIAAREFAGLVPPTPWFVMATYAAAQLLLVRGLLTAGSSGRARRAVAPAPQ